jgi:CheY-like chemotaxis protein
VPSNVAQSGTGFASAERMAESRSYVVLAFSPQPSFAYFMKGVLDCAGLTAIASSSSADDLEALAERVHPDAIVYDVSYPFTDNWHKLQQVKCRAALRNLPFVITTSEARELFRRVGCSSAIELFARPSDVAAFQSAVKTAIETRAHAA